MDFMRMDIPDLIDTVEDVKEAAKAIGKRNKK